MSEQTIDRIKEGVALIFFITPLAIWSWYSKDETTTVVLGALWSIPFLLYVFDWLIFVLACIGRCAKLVEKISDSKIGYSRLSLYLFLFTCSLLVILMSRHYGIFHGICEKTKELVNGSDNLSNLLHWGVLLFLACFLICMIVNVFVGFVFFVETPFQTIKIYHHGMFIGFIYVAETPNDEMLTEPSNHGGLSDDSQRLMDLLQDYSELTNNEKLENSPMLRAVVLVIRDFLEDFMKMQGRQATGDEIISLDYLKNYVPSTKQIQTFPKASLELMLSSSEYINENFEENPYFNFKMIKGICQSAVEKKIELVKCKESSK